MPRYSGVCPVFRLSGTRLTTATLHRTWLGAANGVAPWHIFSGTGLAPLTCNTCTGTGLTPMPRMQGRRAMLCQYQWLPGRYGHNRGSAQVG